MAQTRESIQFGKGRSFRLLRWCRDISKVEEVLDWGQQLPLQGKGDRWHYHPQTELTLVQQGEGTRFIADHIEEFRVGDLVLIGSNVPHYWHVKGESSGLAIQWYFPMDHGIWAFVETQKLRQLEEAAHHGLQIRNATAQRLRRNFEQLPELSGLQRLASLMSMISVLIEAPKEDLRPLSKQPFSLSGTSEQQDAVSRAVSYILAHYQERLQLKDLLDITSMSRATFARQFQIHAGRSFSVFLNQVRLQAVCRSLRESHEPITSVALNHGFNQLSFFNRLFRREFGLTPSAYREKHLKP
jgi:AraC-like DNA-binding protein/mannose-6-phosphate isomerase-like protein (cupin superfamily)